MLGSLGECQDVLLRMYMAFFFLVDITSMEALTGYQNSDIHHCRCVKLAYEDVPKQHCFYY
jgi:hypothetical protein